jgi:aminoglycoside 3-N-acetyltransferase
VQPERGDPSIEVRPEDVTRALRSVGVSPGDTVFFHSSLSSMGTVLGGPEAVIAGFLDAVAPDGTVAVPTLSQRDRDRRFETWDIRRSPSDVGLITETFRLRPDAIRSDHPTHSVATIGPRAEELTRDHARTGGRPSPWGDRAFAPDSPWDKFYHWNASILFIGVDFHVNTMMHYIQSLIVERAVSRLPEGKRTELLAQVQGWRKPGVWPHYQDARLEPLRREAGLIADGKIGSATLRRIEARPMVDHALAVLEARPQEWFDPAFLQWYQLALGDRSQ